MTPADASTRSYTPASSPTSLPRVASSLGRPVPLKEHRMAENSLQRLHAAGQSIWLDFIDRTILRNGDLQRRIQEDALTGMTSNPSIFEKALAEGTVYDDQIQSTDRDLTAM